MKTALSCLGLLFALFLFGSCGVGCALLVCFAFSAIGADAAIQPRIAPAVQPAIPIPDVQPVCPGPDCPEPDHKRRPWGPRTELAVGQASFGRGALVHDGPTHGGQDVQVDLPADILKRNIASKGLGCCVFRSTHYQGLNQNVPEVIDLPEKMVEAGIEGGGWPAKFDKVMQRFAPNVKYIQVEGGDWSIVKLALKTGRMPNITYNPGHMVNLVKLENGVGTFRDNNKTGPAELEWGTEEAVKQKAGGAKFWAVILLNGRHPAPPRSSASRTDRLRCSLEAPRAPGCYEWRMWPDERDQFALWRDGRQAGVYTSAEDYYREFEAPDHWSKRYRRPPVPLPPAAIERLEAMPAGVYAEAINTAPRYTYCGREISREQAAVALEDDSAKLSLSVIGEPAETARVKADLDAPEFAALKSHVVFQAYARDNWAVSPQRYGFDTTGHPTVYLETPAGEVLWHTNTYEGRATLETLRKKDPQYQPSNDPGIRPPNALSGDAPLFVAVAVLLLVCFGIWLLMSLVGASLGLAAHCGTELFAE